MSSGGSISGQGSGVGAIQAMDWKDAVETVADADIALTDEQTLNGLLTSGSRVGVVGQTDPSENGIYVSAAGPWSRSTDADTDAKVTNGLTFVVGDEGSTKTGTIFVLTTTDPIVLDTTSLTFTIIPPLILHASTHENGGSDEINVDGLSGELADPQPASLATLLDLDSVGDLVISKVGPPGVTEDSASGWVVGDHIFDTLTGIIWAAEDVSVGAAIWNPINRILDGTIANVKLADMNQRTFKGRDFGTNGAPQDLTRAQATALMENFDDALDGTVPPSGGGATNFLRADAVWAVPPDTDTVYVHPDHSGDVTSVADGVQTIADDAVTNAKLANMNSSSIKGNNTGLINEPKDLTIAETQALLNVENGSTADQTDTEIETAYNNQVAIVPQAEAEAGTATTRRGWTAQRVKQAIEALSINEDVFTWVLNGSLDTGDVQDGLRVARKSGTIVGVVVSARQRGGAGSGGVSLFDINKHIPAKPITTQRNNTAGVTVYTTQGNRPDIAGNAANTQNAVKQAPAPDVTTFLAGDFFSMDVDDDGDSGGNSPMDIVVEVFVKYNAT